VPVASADNSNMNQTPNLKSASGLAGRFRRPGISRGRSFAYVVAAVIMASAAGSGALGDYLRTRIELPLLYRVREMAGSGATVSPRLKMVFFDDAAMAWLGAAEPSLAQWMTVLEAIASRKPSAIVINKVFGALPPGATDDDARSFARGLLGIHHRLNVPVIAGAYFQPADNSFREKLTPGSARATSALSWGLDPGIPVESQLAALGFPANDRSRDFLYGPHPAILAGFSGIGAVNYQANMMVPLVVRGRDNSLVPHLAVAGFANRSPGAGFLLVNGTRAPVNGDGELLPDIVARARLARAAISMKHFLDPASRASAASASIQPGDLVFVGNTSSADRADSSLLTPLGEMPASFVVASLVNNFARGVYLQEAPGTAGWWGGGALAGFAVTAMLPVAAGIPALMLAILAWVLVALGLFIHGAIAIPWLAPVAAASVSGILVLSRKASVSRANAIKVVAALDGRVTRESMDSLTRHPERITLECREVPVSVMFVDIAGFSLFAERRGAQEVFDYLREVLSDASRLVLEHKGVIDKSLGDGLLAYFGQDLASTSDQMDHAVRAFECAERIQRAHLIRNQRALADGLPVLPLRIGVNSATCLLGDLGTEQRMDVTIVGGGVNFAKRLEDACDPGTILVSSTTCALAAPAGRRSKFVRKFVRVKHMNALVEAFEFDPLASEPQLKVRLVEAFRKTIAVDRVDRRWMVPEGKTVIMKTELGPCELINFSGRGFAARLPALFARGSRIMFEVGDERLGHDLVASGIRTIEAEVRWSHDSGGRIVHGFSIHGFSEDQAAAFNKALMEFCYADDEFKLPRIG